MDPCIAILLGADVRRACDELPLEVVQRVFRAVHEALERAGEGLPVFTVQAASLTLRCELLTGRGQLVVTLQEPLALH